MTIFRMICAAVAVAFVVAAVSVTACGGGTAPLGASAWANLRSNKPANRRTHRPFLEQRFRCQQQRIQDHPHNRNGHGVPGALFDLPDAEIAWHIRCRHSLEQAALGWVEQP